MRRDLDPSTDPAAYRFCHQVRVRFADTDAMGVVHHARYLPYLEEARVAYLRSVGHPYKEMRADGYELPIVELGARYIAPARFDDVVDVHLVFGSTRGATVEVTYLLTVDGKPALTARTIHAVVDSSGRPRRCPPWLVALAALPGPT